MLNWELKSCSRCGGDLFIDRDADGWYEQCLQCSHRRELFGFTKKLVTVRVKNTPREDWSKKKGNQGTY
jgi:DNA-directed RNA polymerase subunit RPC12/RpoP